MATALAQQLQHKDAMSGQQQTAALPEHARTVMAILQRCLTPVGSAGYTDRALPKCVCWVLSMARGLLQARGDSHTFPHVLQTCILAACAWHATKVVH